MTSPLFPRTTSPLTRELIIAFAGNPNVGKSALINTLSGSRLKVGNWPGVTVEKKEAVMEYQGYTLRLIDLPGTYSLSPYTLEERVCRDFLLQTPPDLIINVIDSNNLEKNLYLTAQLLDLERPMLIALNMWDELQAQGYQLNAEALSKHLGIPVIPTIGPSHWGTDKLLKTAMEMIKSSPLPQPLPMPAAIETALAKLSQQILAKPFGQAPVSLRWLSIKLLEQDTYTRKKIQEMYPTEQNLDFPEVRIPLENQIGDLETAISQCRTESVAKLVDQVLQPPAKPIENLSDRIDQILLNTWIGLPIFMGVLYLVFKLTFDISGPLVDFTDGFFNGFLARWAEYLLSSLAIPPFLISLLKDGVIGGAGLVLSFVPILVFLYLFLALLEESGYMARAAFLMDRFMFRFGLHGQAFVPLLVGFGCNVPAVYASRILENETDRKITVAVLSFMSCGAKLPIYALFTSIFFAQNQAIVLLTLYLLGISVAVFWAVILRKTRFKSEIPVFVMELPPYRLPTLNMLWGSIWQKTRAFIKQAGSVIAMAMILLWCLVNLPYGVPVEQTVLARSAQIIAPLFKPLGFGERWEPVAAILPGFMAKEMVVGTLGVVLSVQIAEQNSQPPSFAADLRQQLQAFYEAGQNILKNITRSLIPNTFVLESPPKTSPLTETIRQKFTPLTAFSYMVFNLLLLSCISVVGAVTHEFGTKYLGFILFLTTGTAYTCSALVYHLGLLFGFGP